MRRKNKNKTDNPTAASATGEPRRSGYESSDVRWAWEAVLAEYDALRREIDVLKQQLERAFTYMITAVVAIVASQAVVTSVTQRLDKHPGVYLGLAVIGLWFPLNHLLVSEDMAIAGSYLRDVVAPKLNNLARLALGVERTPDNYGTSSGEVLGWGDNVANNVPPSMRRRLSSVMAWEEFNALMRFGHRGRKLIFSPMYLLRALLLYAPAGLLFAKYLSLHPRFGTLQIVLLVVLGVASASITLALTSLSNLVRFGQRKGPFGPRRTAPVRS